MKKIEYTPDAADRMRAIKSEISGRYGIEKATKIVGRIANMIDNLAVFEQMGSSVEQMFGIPYDWRYIFVERNYVFYRVEEDCIKVINIYNEKEDFMWSLFGICTTSEETNEYWKE